ncbi:hypothetical protein MIMGU_mgv1a018637mg [Erythranthe guttata]|uniref:Disease resistance protein RGA3 n=1 Tax=Erythranthe guttata TaxID=4155 RepID=A0A022PN71_ERYGU|nr:hypothetical protein MIMGU_mgv1a018637mg [Erythranthe guttata]
MAGKAVLGAAIKVLLQNLISILREQISFFGDFNEDLKRLKVSISTIQSFLNDAEKKQFTDETVERWLRNLKRVAFDAGNVLDELNYQLLSKKLHTDNTTKTKVRGFFPHNIHRLEMARKVNDIIKNFEEINDEARKYGLQNALDADVNARFDGIGPSAGLEIDSFSIDTIFLARENDVSEIVKMMTTLPNDQVLSILPIFGIGGLGKSTVARQVFNHEKIKTHFAKCIWVHVSENFDDTILFKKILISLTETNAEFRNKQTLLETLQRDLGTARFLLVLDDVWNDSKEKWDEFIIALIRICSATGNGIIVTTRRESVASLVTTLPIYILNNLSEDECWSIIKSKVVGEGNIPSEFETIGVCIAKRCRGLPLAANVVGGLLRGKSIDDWLFVEKNWVSDIGDEKSVSNILKLSFDHLSSPSLKMCFAYCSIFPKGFNFEREKLVELWMAEGFLGGNDDMEIVGYEFFNLLLQNALLLQFVLTKVYHNIMYYNMHSIVHDLASSILNLIDQARYIGMQSISGESRVMPKEQASCLRTLLFTGKICDLIFSEFKSLHVLILNPGDGVSNVVEELPSSIRELVHLRCLDVSGRRIMCLPDSIGELYHLQTLRTYAYLKKLPNTLKDLISLRHLHIRRGIKLPPEMGRLTSLRTLQYFGVGDEKGRRIGELGSLKNLKGELEIYNLEMVRDKEESLRAHLFQKPNIVKLKLEWGFENREGENNDENVLEGLQPNPNLKSLCIRRFGGRRLPSWCSKMSGLNNLTEITIEGCTECEQVPTLGHLPHLKNLYLISLENVESIGLSFYGIDKYGSTSSNTCVTVFPALERLELFNMSKLTEWLEAELTPNATENRRPSDRVVVFPCLEHLMVKDCKQLTSAPSHFPWLKELEISQMHNGLPLVSICGVELFSLTRLRIDSIDGLVCLPDWLFRNNRNLMWLQITHCSRLRELPNDLYSLVALEILSIEYCHNLKTITHPHESNSAQLLGLTCLRELSIRGCRELTNLPSEMMDSCASSLEKLQLFELSKMNMEMLIGSLQKMSLVDAILKASPKSLRKLDLYGTHYSQYLPNQLQHLTTLSELCLWDFGEMEELLEWFGNNGNNLCSSLQKLTLCYFKKLRRLPSKEAMLRLSKLRYLYIYDCPMLNLKRIRDGDDSEWPKISHIPYVSMNGIRIPTNAH